MENKESAAASRPHRRLADALREVKNQVADRDDVVVEMREASRMRLELLAQELEPVFADVPADDILFDFAISSGIQPRLWIDAVAHVALGRDRRTYRFVRDTRLGRTVLAETPDMKRMADSVARYIAERMIERQRLLDGDVVPVTQSVPREGERDAIADAEAADAPASVQAEKSRGWRGVASALGVMLLGGIVGAALVVAVFWDRVAAYFAAG